MEIRKKGEITSQTIVILIVLIIGFGILLWFFLDFITESDIDREVCHESVILRGTLPDALTAKELPPLKCKTKSLCISGLKKGECEDSGENFNTARVSLGEEQDTEIKMQIAREMADCWSMMGEGKIQVFAREIINTKKKCVICSRIEFDKSLEINEINGMGNYLMTHKVPGKEESYWEFLTRDKFSENLFVRSGETERTKAIGEADVLSGKQKAVVFVEFDKSKVAQWIGIGSGASAGIALGAGVGSIVPIGGTAVGAGAGLILGTLGGYTGYNVGENIDTYMGEFIGEYRAGLFLVDEYSAEEMNKLGCDSFESIV